MKVLKYMSIGLLALAISSCGSDYLDRDDLRGLDADAAACYQGVLLVSQRSNHLCLAREYSQYLAPKSV